MAIQVRTWQDLAEKTFFGGLTAKEIDEIGLSFKHGKDFSTLVYSMKSTRQSSHSYKAIVAERENILKEHLEEYLKLL